MRPHRYKLTTTFGEVIIPGGDVLGIRRWSLRHRRHLAPPPAAVVRAESAPRHMSVCWRCFLPATDSSGLLCCGWCALTDVEQWALDV